MDLQQWVLDNGLKVMVERHPQMKSVSVGFFVRTGSRDESAALNGVSHFLEHMLFKGTQTRSGHDIDATFDRLGAEYNAFTGYEYTGYYVRVLPEHLEEAFDVLADMMRPALRQEDFDIEKNVILEEIALYEDRPGSVLQREANRAFYGQHPLAQEILGSTDAIRALTRDQMVAYHADRYGPPNLTLAVVGELDPGHLRELVNRHCAAWTGPQVPRSYPEHTPQPETIALQRDNVTRLHGVLLCAGPAYQDPRYEAMDLLIDVLGHPGNSRLYWALVDKGLVDHAAASFHAQDRVGMISVSYSCAPQEAEAVLDVVDAQIARLLREGVGADELEGARNRVLTSLAIEGEQSLRRLFPLAFDALYGQPHRSLDEVLATYERVGLDDVNALLKAFPFAPRTQATMGPKPAVAASSGGAM